MISNVTGRCISAGRYAEPEPVMPASSKHKTEYVCSECGHVSLRWFGKCPGCGKWDSLVEEKREKSCSDRHATLTIDAEPVQLAHIDSSGQEARIPVEVEELDRVLGGGLVAGGLVLLGGEPGIGKSTLLLQILMRLSRRGLKVLYISGEESITQIRMRASRLGTCPEGLWSMCESDIERIQAAVKDLAPDFLAIDSIQTVTVQGIPSAPGSVVQIRESTARIMQIAKSRAIPTVIVGHVTKDGAIAGPRMLEHLVDTVLYFEGDRSHSFRLLRTVKNRYGPAFEIGVFEMTEGGLRQVRNPSRLFMGTHAEPVPGAVTVPCLEGSRPLMVEIQALATPSNMPMPRRTTTGIESNRLAMLVAVAQRQLALPIHEYDLFVNVAGGLKISEPAADLGIAAAMVSSMKEKAFPAATAIFGEIGLTGELRAVGGTELRVSEAARLGFSACILPEAGLSSIPDGIKILQASDLKSAIELAGLLDR